MTPTLWDPTDPATSFSSDNASATLPRRLLGIWAHPDDEAYLSAGLMGHVLEAGGVVKLITLTDGEAGFPADDDRSAEERASLRRHELDDAMSVIGVTDITRYGYADGAVADVHLHDLSNRLADELRSFRPDVIVTFGSDGMTGHEDHVANSQAVTRAWLDTGIGDLWYATKTQAWFTRWHELHQQLGVWMSDDYYAASDQEIVHELVVDDGELDRKRKVLAGHGSQTDGLSEVMGEDSYRQWIADEMFRRPNEQELFDCDSASAIASWCHPNNPFWRFSR